MKTINKEKLKEIYIEAEKGDLDSRAVLKEVLRPQIGDTVDLIEEKIRWFIKIFFNSSLTYEDAPFHEEIDHTYAEQIHSYLNYGKPRWKGVAVIGYRESAKTTRVKFNEVYLAAYLPTLDYTSVVSEDRGSADQFNMDMFNILGFSKISTYYDMLSLEMKKKKESQTMSKFTTTTGVTFASAGARKSQRGNVKVDITDEQEVETKRPKKVIFDDIENETTVRSLITTQLIERVIQATIDGLDQTQGSWILIGNYLSLRGNIAKILNKRSEDVKIIMIPILDGIGQPTWKDKYTLTDQEANELAKQGIVKRSIESIKRDSDNFETEYLNNPRRSLVYFPDQMLINFIDLVQESQRVDGLLVIEEPIRTNLYIISVDTATGRGQDESAFVVLRTSGLKYEEVANFKSNKINPEDFATLVANIAAKYNHAIVIPENNYPGNEFIAFLKAIYNNIYHVMRVVDGKEVPEYGVSTNLKSKPEMFLRIKQIMKDDLLTIRSQILYNQISEYPATDVLALKRDGGGGHFDLLMALAVGLYRAVSSTSELNTQAVDERLARVARDIFKDVETTR